MWSPQHFFVKNTSKDLESTCTFYFQDVITDGYCILHLFTPIPKTIQNQFTCPPNTYIYIYIYIYINHTKEHTFWKKKCIIHTPYKNHQELATWQAISAPARPRACPCGPVPEPWCTASCCGSRRRRRRRARARKSWAPWNGHWGSPVMLVILM